MKKKYLGFGLVYCVLVLLIFLAAVSFFTKKKIDEQNDSLRSISRWPEFRMAYADYSDEEALVGSTIDSWEFLSRLDDIGVYSSVVETNNGGVLFESQDYFVVRYYGEFEFEIIENSAYRYEEKSTQLAPGDYRFMVFEEPVSLTKDELTDLRFPNNNNVTITGARCDDTFIYGGALTFTTTANEEKTFNIAKSDSVNEADSVPYEEWVVRIDEIEHYSYDVNSWKNKKAHKLSDAYVDQFMNGKASDGVNVKRGVFTSTVSEIFVFDKGHYLVTYYFVMYPLQIVLRNNLMIYILSVLALVLVEAVIIYAVRKLYRNQKRFELRSEKLTKGIAYDLQGPLAVTRDYLEKWESLDEDKRSECSEKIISEVDHMSSLVTRLLELSKLTDGSVKLNREDVDLLKLTQSIMKRNRKAMFDKKIDVTFGYDNDEDAYPVSADLEMMYIVINNFMTNAIKYCDHTITIRLKKFRNSIEFSITNDGAGINKTDLDKVWDVLYNSDKGRSETDENSGVGLSVVKSILDAHNAKYGCYSGYKGTNFWFMMDVYDDRSIS
ncbi:MAG: HAMP domain-containing histidine kinase [Clostridiales bacterium]|nr:HAMP domain-containing histidine kinase [Clostridiales bacterium]